MKKIIFIIFLGFGILLVGEWSFAADQPAAPQVAPSPGVVHETTGTETQQTSPNSTFDKIGEVLLVFLVLSIVFESALTPLFNWSIFLKYIDGRGWKVPITVVLAFLMFWKYDLDIVRDLLIALDYYRGKIPENHPTISFWGQALTALLIAGGSDGVFRLFAKAGIRNPADTRQRSEALKATVNGKLVVTLSGADQNSTRSISLDGSRETNFTDDSKEVPNLSPGDHSFTVSAKVGGQPKTSTQQFKIENGATVYALVVL